MDVEDVLVDGIRIRFYDSPTISRQALIIVFNVVWTLLKETTTSFHSGVIKIINSSLLVASIAINKSQKQLDFSFPVCHALAL